MSVRVEALYGLSRESGYARLPQDCSSFQRHSNQSLGMRPRQDYTHCVMLNDCVSARLSLLYGQYQYLAHTSLKDMTLLRECAYKARS